MEKIVSAQLFDGPYAVRAARAYVQRMWEALGLGDKLDDVLLCVSELATNAVAHGCPDSPFMIKIQVDRRRARVECHDRGSAKPTPRVTDWDDTDGRGLPLVEMLSARWGVDLFHRAGKAVWFEMDLKSEDRQAC